MIKIKSISLRNKLVGFIIVVLTFFTIATSLVFYSVSTSLEKQTAESLIPYSSALSEAISSQFFERYTDIQAFARNRGLLSKDKNVYEEILNDYIKMYQIYDLLIFIDTDGKFLASNTKDPQGNSIDVKELSLTDYNSFQWFKDAKNGNFSQSKAKGFDGTVVEDVHIDRLSSKIFGKSVYGNSFSAPVKDGAGSVIGILTARAGFRWVENEFISTYKSLKRLGYDQAELTLLNKKGEVIVDYDPYTVGNEDIHHDFANVLLKLNLIKKKVKSAIEISHGNTGYDVSFHARKKIWQVAGFAFIDSNKFLSEQLGWGVMLRIPKDIILQPINEVTTKYYIIVVASFIFSILAGLYVTKLLVAKLDELSEQLDKGSATVASASYEISQSSFSLSEATSEQASFLQETVASIQEISAMVNKNADNARESKELAASSETTANNGKLVVDRMIEAITEISDSNQEIQEHSEKSTSEIANIVTVIGEITEKTKIINDIVFQTKLLSFNASVEAQRAGEHGKGFAVVAEEVGNLAKISGVAAHEISHLLDDSTQKVRQVVEETTEKIELLVKSSQEKIELGKETAIECVNIFEELQKNIAIVSEKTTQISQASDEQNAGIKQITEAMDQLDSVTHKNSSVAHQNSASAKTLSDESSKVGGIVIELNNLVNGDKVSEEKSSHLKKAS